MALAANAKGNEDALRRANPIPIMAMPTVMAGLNPFAVTTTLESSTPTRERANWMKKKNPARLSSSPHLVRNSGRRVPMKVMMRPFKMKLKQSRKKIVLREDVAPAGWVCVFEDIMAFCRSRGGSANARLLSQKRKQIPPHRDPACKNRTQEQPGHSGRDGSLYS